MKKELKAEYWLKCWIAVANSSNSTAASIASTWADKMISDFDKRFPEILYIPKVDIKEEVS